VQLENRQSNTSYSSESVINVNNTNNSIQNDSLNNNHISNDAALKEKGEDKKSELNTI